ncbi:toxin-antitoxin system YwqK family antitoxin [Wohlfahrtiimonas chitiniclastica]|uniref:toxin-antitoxin system YwqK family antitoxin n=1 Tax=Wohlfahrtiimonas chitiniclastica TaxID=400946 RepID=UPI001FED688F|nr:hypothetical protein [Wohlfahrtiimonas chitiniclastica]
MSEYQIKLTQAERDTIQKLYDGKAQGNPPNWSHAYTAIAELLEKKLDLDNIYTGNGELRKGEDHPVVVWFRGAAQANNPDSTSVYSVMIREYSEQQMALRGISYSDALMQQASNKVAENAMNDILDRELDQDGFYSFPTIEDISLQDAIGVGQVLFSGLENGDTAKSDGENAYASMNAGWSGTMLFTSLGSDQTWRLFTAGDYLGDNDEYGDRINKVSFNRMDDLKNVLFAYFSMKKAISATILDKDGNFLSGSWDQFKTDAGIGKDTYDISSVGELWDLVWVNFRGDYRTGNIEKKVVIDEKGIKRAEYQLIDGHIGGPYRLWREDGTKKEEGSLLTAEKYSNGQFKKTRYFSEKHEYDEKNTLRTIIAYSNDGSRLWDQTFYSNGSKKSMFIHDYPSSQSGEDFAWYENGQAMFKKHKQTSSANHGWAEYWHSNGEKRCEGMYDSDGLWANDRVGIWKVWDEVGDLIAEGYFSDNKIDINKPHLGTEEMIKECSNLNILIKQDN